MNLRMGKEDEGNYLKKILGRKCLENLAFFFFFVSQTNVREDRNGNE